MKLKGNTVLITGGSSGIGLALAERFLKYDNEVIICGSSEEKLKAAKEKFSKLHTFQCDISGEADRISFYDKVTKEFPNLNILINNAGIQQRVNLKELDWDTCKKEIATNLEAPIHFSSLFIPNLMLKKDAFIVNVSSGLAFMPPIWVPIYGATKAGLHSFTFTLRHQLADTDIGVVEVIPPAVNTDLGSKGVHDNGVDLNEFADGVWNGFADGDLEIGFGVTSEVGQRTRQECEEIAVKVWKQNFNR